MAFTNKKFSREDKEAIIRKIIESEEIQQKMADVVKDKVDAVLGTKPSEEQQKTAPAVEEEGDTVYVTISGVKYKLEEVDVVTGQDTVKKVKLLTPNE